MNDWRLTNQLDYLFKKTLMKRSFSDFPQKDHEHCSFCWDKFGHTADTMQNGYCTEDATNWICAECFEDFKHLFKWSVLDASEYNSLEELYETLLRGNEIEFEFQGKEYFILPRYVAERITGVSIGEKYKNKEQICLSQEQLYNAKIDDKIFGEILGCINIMWDNT